MMNRVVAALLAVALAGCLGGEIVTNPDALPLEPSRLAHLRAPQALTLHNGVTGPARHQFKNDSVTWEVDARQLTDTAIVMLRRAMEKQAIQPAPPGKSATLRVEVRSGMGMFIPIPSVAASARLILHAELGDGTKTMVDGEGASGFGMQGAFESAIQVALYRLVIDPAFVTYMNR